MRVFKPIRMDSDAQSPLQRAVSTALMPEADFLRLQAVARLYARGLPGDVGWRELLNEAVARVLEGKRRPPDGLAMPAFIAGVMRSLRADHWRRVRRERAAGAELLLHAVDPALDPERAMEVAQQLAAIDRLFAGDIQALQVLSGLASGAGPDEIQRLYGMNATDYDSTRKRIRRALLRAGLAPRTPP
jgi:DNA-directed RNA polymerase specialized sigma24 family protein